MDATHYDIKNGPKDGAKIFRKLGTCSRTFFYLLNREFGHPKELEEHAADALAGGILQEGHQCGMLWGSSLAVGAEAFRQCEDNNQAISLAITATQSVMESFKKREHTINCRDITRCDFSNNWSFAKYFFSGRFLHCFKLAGKWAAEAVFSAYKGLSNTDIKHPNKCISCATELVKKIGATEEERIMVAGFAGGLGLSGAGCGALAAAIWLKTIMFYKKDAKKSAFKNPIAKELINRFYETTGSKILCSEITGTHFNSIEEHTRYIKNGGCANLINTIVQ